MNSIILKPAKSIIKKYMWRLPSSVVLMFHHVTNTPECKRSGCLLESENFYCILNQVKAFISCENLLSAKPHEFAKKVAITFDDGLADIYLIAYPYLKQRNIPFTVFIVSDFLDTEGYITTEQLKEMAKDPLVTIGSHGISHEILPSLSVEQKWEEIEASKRELEKIAGKKIKLFAYSHGQYDDKCLEMVSKAGYEGAFSVKGFPFNFYTRNWMYHLPRYNVVNGEVEKIVSIIHSLYNI